MNYFSKNFSTGRQALVKQSSSRVIGGLSSSHVNRQSSIVNNRQATFIVNARQSSIVNACIYRFIIRPRQKWAYGGGPCGGPEVLRS